MDKFAQFFLEFCKIFFGGILGLFYSDPTVGNRGGILGSLVQMFNFPEYVALFNEYKTTLSTGQLIGAILCFLLVIIVFCVLLWLIIHFTRRLLKKMFGDKVLNQDLVDEINTLKFLAYGIKNFRVSNTIDKNVKTMQNMTIKLPN